MISRTAPRLRVRRVLRNRLGVPRSALHSLQWDILAGVCAGVYQGAIFPFQIKIARDGFHATTALLAVLTTAPFLGNLLAPFWAQKMEGRAKMPFVLRSWIPARLLLLLMPMVGGAAPFIYLMSALQVLGTFASPAYASLMRDIYPDHSRGRLMGYVRVGAQLAAFFAAQAAGQLMDHGVSFRVVFPVAGLFGVLAAVAFSQVRPYRPVEEPASGGGMVAALQESAAIVRKNIPYRWFAASVMCYGFGNLMAMPLYGLYQVEHLHITNSQIALLANISALCAIPGSFVWGRFVDRYGPALTVLLSILCVSGLGIVYLFASTITPLFLGAAFAGFGLAGIELGYMASILHYAEPGKAARYQAIHSLLLGVRGVAASPLGLHLLPIMGYGRLFAITFVLIVIGGALQLGAHRAARATLQENFA